MNFSLGHEEEGSLEADSTNLDPRTCSEQFLESLLLAPQNQTLKDLHFSLDHQGRLRLQSMGYRENLFQIHPERIKSFLFTHPRVGNQVLDSSLYEIFRRLDPLELLTRSLQTSAKIHREALGGPNANFL